MKRIKRKIGSNCNLILFLLLVGTIFLTYLALTARLILGVSYLSVKEQSDRSEVVKKTIILEELSEQLKRDLATVQSRPCSNTMALHCGHSENPWEKYMKRIGSNCTTSSVAKIIDLDWHQLTCKEPFNICLSKGIPMPKQFVQTLDQNHDDSFLWLVGQFSNFVFQPNDATIERIKNFKESIGISAQNLNGSPLIGMHVRRTDKYVWETDVRLNATDFMNAAIAYRNENSIDPSKQITIFIATEDNDVITEFRSNYESPSWKFVTGCIKTYKDLISRKSQLFEIIRDVQVLVDSDYVICTYTSNICRLALELRTTASHLKSLDGKYSFHLLKDIIGQRVDPI